MPSVWRHPGEAITAAMCGVFVVTGLLAGRTATWSWASSARFLAGYVTGGYRQALSGLTKLVVERELEVVSIFALSGTLEGYASARTQRDIESLMANLLRRGGAHAAWIGTGSQHRQAASF